jgi:hypothetical protein
MEFWLHNNNRQQLLAVADDAGNLRILEIPRSLWRPDNNEELIVSSFFQREVPTLNVTLTLTVNRTPNPNPNSAGFFFIPCLECLPPTHTRHNVIVFVPIIPFSSLPPPSFQVQRVDYAHVCDGMRLQAKTTNETEAQTAAVDMAEAQVVFAGRCVGWGWS